MIALKLFSWVSLSGLLLACPLFGQVAKPQKLTEKDYGLWSTLRMGEVANDGKFISYYLDYPSGLDTLFVLDYMGVRQLDVPKGYRGAFQGHYFACLKPNGELLSYNLRTGVKLAFAGVDYFQSLGAETLLLEKDSRQTLEIVDLDGTTIHRFSNVQTFAINPRLDYVAVSVSENNSQKLLLASASGSISEVAQTEKGKFENLKWNDGGFLSFIEALSTSEGNEATFNLYTSSSKKISSQKLPEDFGQLFDVGVSPDGKRVALNAICPTRDTLPKILPEVWRTNDPIPYSSQNRYSRMRAWIWDVDGESFSQITDTDFSRALVSADLRFAIVENLLANMPSFKPEPDRDLSIKNLKTGRVAPFLSQFSGQAERLVLSPDGQTVLYFDKGQWIEYTFRTALTKNLTSNLAVAFGDEDNDRPEENRSYGLPIWSGDGKTFYLCDKFDIWAFFGSSVKRLTNGREQSLVYRFANTPRHNPDALVSKGVALTTNNRVLLTITADNHSISGFALLQDSQIQPLVIAKKRLSHGLLTKDGHRLYWLEEDFDQSPQIMTMDVRKKTKTLLFSSNIHQRKFEWGKSELLTYRISSGKLVNGTLFYPAGYDPNKKYPMVVHIYERQTHALHTYKNPSLLENDGFNRTNLTLQGYFVLYPDIWHTVGSPGESALDCTTSAVEHVLSMVPVDRARIGLIGHSMGGYLVNYIVTHSDMFKAAVSGAGAADTVSFYFTMGSNTGIPDASRFEYEQMRTGKSFFDDPDLFRRNSPIEQARNMNSALLLWTGGDDTQVKPWQSMEFHMALRRLGKESTMLVYRGEDHTLDRKENQVDLTRRIEEWFRKYIGLN